MTDDGIHWSLSSPEILGSGKDYDPAIVYFTSTCDKPTLNFRTKIIKTRKTNFEKVDISQIVGSVRK